MELFKPNHGLFDQISDYNYPPNYFNINTESELDSNPVNMHYIDVGEGPVILMVHGMPTWGYLYRDFIKKFVDAGYRCIVPDHIGFGRSDKIGNRDYYSIAKHCENLNQLIQHLNLQQITVLCQDWGGPIGLNQVASMPQRFERLCIMNTWLDHQGFEYSPAVLNWNNNWQPGGLFAAAPQLCSIVPILSAGKYDRNHLSAVASGKLSIEDTVAKTSQAEWQAWSAPFIPQTETALPTAQHPSAGIYAGAFMFPLSLPFYSAEKSNQTVQNENYQTLLSWDRPIHFIWGCQDEVFTEKWGNEWHAKFKQSSFLPIEDAGHFLQNTHGHLIADTLLTEMADG